MWPPITRHIDVGAGCGCVRTARDAPQGLIEWLATPHAGYAACTGPGILPLQLAGPLCDSVPTTARASSDSCVFAGNARATWHPTRAPNRLHFEFAELWYCLARCRDVGSDYNIFFFLFFCSKQQLLCVKNRQHAKRVCESLHAW